MNIGRFHVYIFKDGHYKENISDLSYIQTSFTCSFFFNYLFSLAGIPLLAGFLQNLCFSAVLEQKMYVSYGLLTTVIILLSRILKLFILMIA